MTSWSRDASDIQGLDVYLEERAEKQIFLAWRFPSREFREIKTMQTTRSFYLHYGPIGKKNGSLILLPNLILYLGGSKMSTGLGHKRKDRDFVSNEVFTFDTNNLTWLRFTSCLPLPLSYFGALYIGPYLYLLGGLTDDGFGKSMIRVNSKKLFISRHVYRIHVEDWFSSR